MNGKITKEELKELVQKQVETMMDKLFEQLHQLTKIEAGDMSFPQYERLGKIIKKVVKVKLQLVEFATDKLWQNKLDSQM